MYRNFDIGFFILFQEFFFLVSLEKQSSTYLSWLQAFSVIESLDICLCAGRFHLTFNGFLMLKQFHFKLFS